MPELPEVETVVRGLKQAIGGTTLTQLQAMRPNLRFPIPKNLDPLSRQQALTGLDRRAKYILMHLANGNTIVLHLGMSGRITIHNAKPNTLEKHDHLVFDFSNGKTAVFNDARRFGFIDIIPTDSLPAHKFFAHLGPEPLSTEFDAPYLKANLQGKNTAIKTAIMDQRLVVGVGNIYACEALYQAGIHPEKPARKVSAPKIKKLAAEIKDVLAKAIQAGGSSLKDHRQPNGELGYFQHTLQVYGREGELSPTGRGTIQRIVQAGRSTFYCPVKQK